IQLAHPPGLALDKGLTLRETRQRWRAANGRPELPAAGRPKAEPFPGSDPDFAQPFTDFDLQPLGLGQPSGSLHRPLERAGVDGLQRNTLETLRQPIGLLAPRLISVESPEPPPA